VLRLLLILALLLQPLLFAMALPCGGLAGALVERIGDGGCCPVPVSCCAGGGGGKDATGQRWGGEGRVGHCGQSGMLCRCGRGPDRPEPLPAPQSRTAETLTAILPRLLGGAVVIGLPRPVMRSARALPAVLPPMGADLRAYLCVWLT
jgi:hypothetical protein